MKWLEPYNLPAEAVTGKDLNELEPALSNQVYGGWFYKTDSHLRPEKLLEEWKQAVIRDGGIIEENCEFQSFNLDNQRIAGVKTSKGMFHADETVLAAGAWTDQLSKQLKLNIPIQPAKGYSVTFQSLGTFPEIPCILYEKRVAVTLWGDESRLGGIMEFSGLNPSVVAKRILQIKEGANQYLSESLADNYIEEWAGFRPMCYDDLPVIGRPDRYRNLVVAAGHGTTGLSMAPGTGKLVADIIQKKEPSMDVHLFSPNRF